MIRGSGQQECAGYARSQVGRGQIARLTMHGVAGTDWRKWRWDIDGCGCLYNAEECGRWSRTEVAVFGTLQLVSIL